MQTHAVEPQMTTRMRFMKRNVFPFSQITPTCPGASLQVYSSELLKESYMFKGQLLAMNVCAVMSASG